MGLAQRIVVALLVVGLGVVGDARADTPKPLSEAGILKLVELMLEEDVIVARVQKAGVDFPIDDSAIDRLRKAKVPEAVIAAVRKVRKNDTVVTYKNVLDLLRLGIAEADIIKRLERSPTRFTLDEKQEEELKKAGASAKFTDYLRGKPRQLPRVGDITDFVIILDCSGSMSDKTADGRSKMEVAKKVVAELLDAIPNGRNVAFIVYGHDAALKCKAVAVVQPLSELTTTAREKLKNTIARLAPVGHTPIALSLRAAGKELDKSKGLSGLILITDGMETCHGDPKAEAARLAKNQKLAFGLHVVGFDVDPKERQAVKSIAEAAGEKGRFYDARSPAQLDKAIRELEKKIDPEGKASTKPIILPAKLGKIKCLAFSPDSKMVALGGTGPKVALWDVTTAKQAVLEDHPGEIYSLAFSPDGKALAVGSWKQAKLWDPATGKELSTLKGHTCEIKMLLFLPDSKTLITGSGLDARGWQLNSDKDPVIIKNNSGGLWTASPDGKRLAKKNVYWNNIGLWDGVTGTFTRDIPCSGTACFAFSPDGLILVAGAKEQVRLFSTVKKEMLASHELHTNTVVSVEMAPDGKTIVSGSADKTAILWDVSTKKERATLKGHKGNVTAGYCREGKMVCTWSANDDTVRLWDTATGKELGSVAEKQRISLAVVSPDGKTLATATPDGIVRLRNIDAVLAQGK